MLPGMADLAPEPDDLLELARELLKANELTPRRLATAARENIDVLRTCGNVAELRHQDLQTSLAHAGPEQAESAAGAAVDANQWLQVSKAFRSAVGLVLDG